MTKTIKSKTLLSSLFVALLCVLLSVSIVLPTSAATSSTDKWEGVNFNGTEIVLNLNNWEPTGVVNAGATNGIKYIMGPDEYTTDSVQNAVFDRNKKVTSKLGINIKYNQDTYPSATTLPIIENFILADLEDAPDIIQAPGYSMVRAGIKGLLYNALTKDEEKNYFDITAENGWYTDFMFENTLDQSKIFLLAGDYFIDVLRYSYGVFVNIDMYEDLFASEGGIASLYETIQAGDWTYDELMRCADAAYIDNGSVGSVDQEDIFGVAAGASYYYRTLFSTSGLDVFEEKDGKAAYIEDVSEVHAFVDKLIGMLSHDAFLNPQDYRVGDYEVTKLFTNGKTLFALDQFLLNLEGYSIRNMEQEVGVVPYPKYTKDTGYATLISDHANLGGILYNSDKFAESSALLQMMCEESYNGRGTPMYEYYDVTLKFKYFTSAEQMAILDIIRNGICSPKSFLFDNYFAKNAGMNTYGVLMADAIKSGVNTFATEWAFQYATVQSSLENTYERFGVLDADIIPSGSCGENARWEYNAKTGELKILGRGAMTGFSSLWSPWYSYRSDIKTVTIADGITEIGDYAFYDCSSLKNIIFLPENPVILGLSVFRYSPLEAIYVPASALDAYKSHEDWAEYKDLIFPIESTVKYGDVDGDGDIGALDVLMIRKYAANNNYSTGTSTVEVQAGADVNGDGDIGAPDVLMLRKYMASYNYTTGTSPVVLGPQK